MIHIEPLYDLRYIQKSVESLTQQDNDRDVGLRNIFDSSWDKDKQWCREVERIQMIFSQLQVGGMNPKDLKLHAALKSKINHLTDAAESIKEECAKTSKQKHQFVLRFTIGTIVCLSTMAISSVSKNQ